MGYKVAVIGATGNVGREMLNILAEREFPADEVFAIASRRSMGVEVSYGDSRLKCQDLEQFDFRGIDFALMSAGSAVSKEWSPRIGAQGCVVIDNSSCWRYDPDVPLIVPEVNAQALASMPRGIVSIPNCTTTPLVMALKPLHDAVGVKRVVVTTFQSVSGTGAAAMDELVTQTKDLMAFRNVKTAVYPYQIAFNLLPHIGSFNEQGDCSEEVKIANETRKILGAPTLRVTATTVRVPVLRCHSEAINVELDAPLKPNEARAALAAMPGVIVYDDPSRKLYPMPLDATGKDEVYIGRIREDVSTTNGLNLWVVSDNLRKGAALNAVQIAECLVRG